MKVEIGNKVEVIQKHANLIVDLRNVAKEALDNIFRKRNNYDK